MKFFKIFGAALAAAFLAGCAAQPKLTADQIAKLEGGTTKVVAFGFCVPMDHLIQTAITRHTMTFVVNGKKVGTMKTCSHATFNVPSGYWEAKFVPSALFAFPHTLLPTAYHPGKTQYLHMRPGGNGTYDEYWVTKEEAEKSIAAIKKIGQMF